MKAMQSPPSTDAKHTKKTVCKFTTPRWARYPAEMSETSSGIGNPRPQSSNMPARVSYTADGGSEVSWASSQSMPRGLRLLP